MFIIKERNLRGSLVGKYKLGFNEVERNWDGKPKVNLKLSDSVVFPIRKQIALTI